MNISYTQWADLVALIGAGAAQNATGWIATADAWTYASASTIIVPSGAAAKYSPGMRIQLTQTTVKYFIVTAVADTLLTVYGGSTPYTVANANISAISYSTVKAPLGFPLDPALWTVQTVDVASRSTTTEEAWININAALAIAIPLGVWFVDYTVDVFFNAGTTTAAGVYATLSTANNSESDPQFTSHGQFLVGSAALAKYVTLERHKTLTLAAATTYYLNCKANAAGTSLAARGDLVPTIINARCAYL